MQVKDVIKGTGNTNMYMHFTIVSHLIVLNSQHILLQEALSELIALRARVHIILHPAAQLF